MSRDRKLSKLYTSPKTGSWAHRFDLESIATADLQEHRRLRKSIAAGFKPEAVARMEQQVAMSSNGSQLPFASRPIASTWCLRLLAQSQTP
jgi:cytochrome P450